MKSWKDNGEYWYCDERSLWLRIRQWFIWVGGWEAPNGRGWTFWSKDPAPVSFFGHRATYFSWGIQVRLKHGIFVLTWRQGNRTAYISADGTPTRAYHWLWHPPREVLAAIELRSQSVGTTADSTQSPAFPGDSAPSAHSESDDPGSF